MEKSDFYSTIGLFVIKNFLPDDLCARVRSEMVSSDGRPAHFVRKDKNLFDEKIRRTMEKQISPATISLISGKLSNVRGGLEDYFGMELARTQGTKFLYYKEGDFFQRHYDKGINPENPDPVKDRKVSTVIFLNSETDELESGSYTGGSLIIYGAVKDPRFKSHGFRVIGVTGMLLAFRSDLLHEVKPVKEGVRYTAVDWFI